MFSEDTSQTPPYTIPVQIPQALTFYNFYSTPEPEVSINRLHI